MVATQSHGRWSRGVPLVLPAGAAAQPYAQVNGLACRSAGNCVAVGDYEYGRSRNLQAFIAIESHGKWARAFTPRLPANASSPASAQLEAVACTRDGSCAAVGSYQDSSGNAQTMVLAKPPAGPWRQATEIGSPPNAAANPDAFMTGIACSGPGTCVAVGNYSVSPTRVRGDGRRRVAGRLAPGHRDRGSARRHREHVHRDHLGFVPGGGPVRGRRPVRRLGHAEPRDGGDRVEGPVRPGLGDHRGAAGRQRTSEQLSARRLLPALRRLLRGRRRAGPGGPFGGHVPGQVGRPLAGGVPCLAGRGHGRASASCPP